MAIYAAKVSCRLPAVGRKRVMATGSFTEAQLDYFGFRSVVVHRLRLFAQSGKSKPQAADVQYRLIFQLLSWTRLITNGS